MKDITRTRQTYMGTLVFCCSLHRPPLYELGICFNARFAHLLGFCLSLASLCLLKVVEENGYAVCPVGVCAGVVLSSFLRVEQHRLIYDLSRFLNRATLFSGLRRAFALLDSYPKPRLKFLLIHIILVVYRTHRCLAVKRSGL